MNELQIAAAQELSKLEGMDKSPYILILTKSITRVVERVDVSQSVCGKYRFNVDEYRSETPCQVKGSYLTMKGDTKWSPAKILSMSGWDANKESIVKFMDNLIIIPNFKDFYYNKLKEIEKALKEGNHELAHILAIILLQKIDNEAYLKAMEPLK